MHCQMRRTLWADGMVQCGQTCQDPCQKNQDQVVEMSSPESAPHSGTQRKGYSEHFVHAQPQDSATDSQTAPVGSRTEVDHRCVWHCWRPLTRRGSCRAHSRSGKGFPQAHIPRACPTQWKWMGLAGQACSMTGPGCWGWGTPRMHWWRWLLWDCAVRKDIAYVQTSQHAFSQVG